MTATEIRPDTAVRANPARDTWNVLTRELKPVARDPFTLIFSLVQPLVFLGLFAPLLIGSSGAPVGETLQWFVPGVLVMIVLFGTGATGSNLQYEMMTGSHERTLVAPLARSSLLVGRALKEIADCGLVYRLGAPFALADQDRPLLPADRDHISLDGAAPVAADTFGREAQAILPRLVDHPLPG